eukprot:TRINITY_DN15824_c0_g1_i1.p1 TRINITY_DN15824_c0_g1~~TRINITY_DN15824_c0_g1_i1.p1  ORF type:complete len:259 (+),score=33.86 TRINITY_DN15824_c0_g1_i1:93-869(+)
MVLTCSLCCGADPRSATHIENVKEMQSSFLETNSEATGPPPCEPASYQAEEVEKEPTKDPMKAFVASLDTSLEAQDSADREFNVTVVREDCSNDNACVDVIACSDGRGLQVLTVNSGPIQTWNFQNEENVHVRHLDRIIKVNDITGDATAMTEAIYAQWKMLNMTIVRPREFKIRLEKGPMGKSAKIGLDVVHFVGQSLNVRNVREGLASEWNKTFPSVSVKPGDKIVEINGTRGCSAKLLNIVQFESNLEIVLCRIP